MADYKIKGNCLCGGVQYECTSRPGQVLNCHCMMCRKAIGCAYGSFAAIPHPTHFHLIKDETLREYRSSDITLRKFCGVCGSSMFIKYDIEPDTIWVSLGTMEGDPGLKVECNIFAKYKAPWLDINDGLPISDEGDLWKENAGKLALGDAAGDKA